MSVRPVMALDAVIRRQRYEHDHEVDIQLRTAPVWHWTATWIAPDGRQCLITDHDLGSLISALEALRDDGPALRDGGQS